MADSGNTEVRRIKCLFCDSTFRDNFNVRRHINSKHPELASEILKINCSLCGLIYIRKKHEKPPVELCQECRKRTDIAPPECYRFVDEEEFNLWKQKLELETSTRFIKSRRTTNLEDGTVKTEFPCYRSTFSTSKKPEANQPSSGTPKKVATCTAKMICEFATDGSVNVSFFSEHKGHPLDANQVLEKGNKKESVQIQQIHSPQQMSAMAPVLMMSPTMEVHHNYLQQVQQQSYAFHQDNSLHQTDSLSNDYFANFHQVGNNPQYNSELDLVLRQIENEGQLASNHRSSFSSFVQNIASNGNENYQNKTPAKPIYYRTVMRDNCPAEVGQTSDLPVENPMSNRMTEEERQSIYQMVLDEL